MNSTPNKNGRLTSTPLRHFWDSGYFGSGDVSPKNSFHISPLEDCSPFKKPRPIYCEGYDDPSSISKKILTPTKLNFTPEKSYQIEVSPSSGFKRRLQFSSARDSLLGSPFGGRSRNASLEQTERSLCNLNRVFQNSRKSAAHAKRSITTSNQVDILSRLNEMNCSAILDKILCQLDKKDICRVYNVCRSWRKIVRGDTPVCDARNKFLKDKEGNKENRMLHERVPLTGESQPLSLVNTHISKQPLAREHNTKFKMFVQEAQNLRKGILLKCPVCSCPAKESSPSRFICVKCRYVFCNKCLNPYVSFHDCSTQIGVPDIPNLIIGSKKSKRNLKRL